MVCCSSLGCTPLPRVSDQIFAAQQLADIKGTQGPEILCAAAQTDLAGSRGGYHPNALRTAEQQAP